MGKEFDFKNIGKQMPYRTPDDFFGKMQEQMLERVCTERVNKLHRMRMIVSAVLTVAAVLLGIVFFPVSRPATEEEAVGPFVVSADLGSSYPDAMDYCIASMSDEELSEWVELSKCDVFID